ncbi:hypothetical protein [Pseudodesulfovibrio piezophilus]|uniref:Uncharacterized protein n=1 Tax=Pseudodesulfovibrio piezophilus (strain DSM 21447 / JCM 15486 / C1TLV30) TaxID=1322246 RepID=M1WVL3_PSEP2|nr:hypothetical protein [Pseudodesulfovibrio piezophilus]CCH48573.1 protein of unknown function [Pseudodesulfovibrio piezophilus C1TLV30]
MDKDIPKCPRCESAAFVVLVNTTQKVGTAVYAMDEEEPSSLGHDEDVPEELDEDIEEETDDDGKLIGRAS